MCKVIKTKTGKYCKRTGLPITVSNIIGEFCDKECDLDSILYSKARAEQWLNDMGPIFEQLKEKK